MVPVITESYYIQNQHHVKRQIYYSKVINPNVSLGLYIASYTDVLQTIKNNEGIYVPTPYSMQVIA